ncbi:Mitotic catastrophe suppressor 4 [Hyphodiscus hymeniophilus]|uniref:Mitotic catastrophe suppressor 4 n=1 Tax=Hyphodiscus hymeniophilus TaxID=353542 RepID=A0A9P6SJJ7_9HELO|nr:Mitotic catastrophe suppressor 4 [Hyphodiscus hymeniophilus]
MGTLRTRIRNKFTRRPSAASSVSSDVPADHSDARNRNTSRSLKSKAGPRPSTAGTFIAAAENSKEKEVDVDELIQLPKITAANGVDPLDLNGGSATKNHGLQVHLDEQHHKHDSTSTADFPTPNTEISPVQEEHEGGQEGALLTTSGVHFTTPVFDSPSEATPNQRPAGLSRQQSLLPHAQQTLIQTLLETDLPPHSRDPVDYFESHGPARISANMVSRKIWVKRPGASATLVTIHEDDLVDDVRDMILKKYANSLGRSFDAPDVTLRIVPRDAQERTLGPEEPMTRTLDAYFPGGQTVAEALVIDVPLRRTPKPSPRPHASYYEEDRRPAEAGTDYFPPMPLPATMPSPHLSTAIPIINGQHAPLSHSMSVLTTGHVPNLPSPGSVRRRHHERDPTRPLIRRQHTSASSPVLMTGSMHQVGGAPHNGSYSNLTLRNSIPRSPGPEKSIPAGPPPAAPPLPTPPPAQSQVELASQIQRVATPPPRVSSPRPTNKPRRTKKSSSNDNHPSLPAGMLNGAVPPINVLIVEDNIINLKLLEAFMKRLKVRWQTAMNGREAVTKWRAGGFHLVLMDIQLPIMSGLEATKEIRRLERLNSIGVFSSSASSSAPSVEEESGEVDGVDKLPSTVLFRSPVIIVALTASSLQSDRHEALAAGCNDFLTKPVNFVWLERKVMEWGCMQALIDFDGWRKWKDFSSNNSQSTISSSNPSNTNTNSSNNADDLPTKERKLLFANSKKKKANRTSFGSSGGTSTARPGTVREDEKEDGVAV